MPRSRGRVRGFPVETFLRRLRPTPINYTGWLTGSLHYIEIGFYGCQAVVLISAQIAAGCALTLRLRHSDAFLRLRLWYPKNRTHRYRRSGAWVGSTLLPPVSLPAAVRLNDLRIVPSGVDHAQFPAFLARNARASPSQL